MDCTNEVCGACGHTDWHHMHIKIASDRCLGGLRRNDYCAADCRAFVPSGRFICDGLINGDYRSPNGANRLASCETRATFTTTSLESGAVHHYCGRHVRSIKKHLSMYYDIVPAAVAKEGIQS